jgi:hypothetical protein
MAGRPRGIWGDKAFRDALNLAVREKEGGKPRLRLLAEQLVTAGLAGDVMAIREVADRLDGKPTQQTEMTISDQRTVVRAPNPSESPQDWSTEYGPTVGNA